MLRLFSSFVALPILALASTAGASLGQSASSRATDALGVTRASVQALQLPQRAPARLRIPLFLGAQRVVLDLQSHDVRAPGYRLLVDDGTRIREAPIAPSSTFQGSLLGRADSSVAATLHGAQLTAWICLEDKTVFAVQPARALDGRYAEDMHVVYAAADAKPFRGRFSAITKRRRAADSAQGGSAGIQSSNVLLAELAADADFDFYKRSGSNVQQTERQIATLVNALNVIYKRDVELDVRVTSTLVRTSATYTKTDARDLLLEFSDRWNRQHRSVRRDLAHLFSGKGSFSGILGNAELATVCNTVNAYGVSRVVSTQLSLNVALLCHQIAHNFDALHCDAATQCWIMCSKFGGCGRNLGAFAPATRATIIKYKNSLPCLSSAQPPVLTSIAPQSVQAFGAPQLTLTGTRLNGVSEIQVGSSRITSFSATNTSIQFQLGTIASVGALPVRVVGPAGPSNSVTLTIAETRPPVLVVPSVALSNFQMLFGFGAAANATYIVVVAPNAQTLRFRGFDILQNLVPLRVGTTNAAGLGSFSLRVPAGLQGRMWSQLVTDKGGRFDGASTISSTLFF